MTIQVEQSDLREIAEELENIAPNAEKYHFEWGKDIFRQNTISFTAEYADGREVSFSCPRKLRIIVAAEEATGMNK